MIKIVIKSNDRVYIGGRTGSGKSYLARKIIQSLPRCLIYDSSWECSNLGYVVHNLNELKKCSSSKIVYQPMNPADINHFDEFCKFAFTGSNYTIYIDEIHLYTTPYNIPNNLKNLVVMGRKKGIGLVMVSQRPAMTHSTLLSQSTHIICFNLHLERDIEFFKPFLGDENANKIRTLPQYHYLHYDIPANAVIVRKEA